RVGGAAARVPQRVRTVRHRRAHVHRGTPGYGRHPLAAVHLDRIPDRRPARPLRAAPGDEGLTPRRHLDGDSLRSRDPLWIERPAVPPGKVARHPGRDGARAPARLTLATPPSQMARPALASAGRRKRGIGRMPWPGFEPGCLAALPPQDSVSTSFTTRAGEER